MPLEEMSYCTSPDTFVQASVIQTGADLSEVFTFKNISSIGHMSGFLSGRRITVPPIALRYKVWGRPRSSSRTAVVTTR